MEDRPRRPGSRRLGDLADTLATVGELLALLEAVEVLTWEKFWWLLRYTRDHIIPAWQSTGRIDTTPEAAPEDA